MMFITKSTTSTRNLMLKMKLALMSTGLLSLLLLIKLSRDSLPVLSTTLVSELPVIYNSVVAWLRPPYLYLLVNCIIISIVASSKLQVKTEEAFASAVHTVVPLRPDAEAFSELYRVVDVDKVETGDVVEVVKEVVMPITKDDDDLSAVRAPGRSDSVELLVEAEEENEKPLVSTRFGHRKPQKQIPEGKASALGVSRSKKQDTLENTWKMITDGRSMPLTRHLKKSETWDTNHVRSPTSAQNKMKKSETFSGSKTCNKKKKIKQSDCADMNGIENQKLRREPSLTQDELNRRVEAFINKFNEEMRLQRQQSLNQYLEMINEGGYREFY